MHKQWLLAAAAVVLGTCAAQAQAQTIVDGNSVDEILNIARGYGAASLEATTTGDPIIRGRVDGIPYQVAFVNCTNNADCEDLNFYAGFQSKQPIEVVNAWNRDKRFGRAYLDSELDAVVEFDVNLEHGVTRENMDASFLVWTQIVDQYATYIGFK